METDMNREEAPVEQIEEATEQASPEKIPEEVPPAEEKKIFCTRCGKELQEGQEFCPHCGQKVGEPLKNKLSFRKPPKGLLVVVAVAVIAVAAGIFALLRGPQPKSISLNRKNITIREGEQATLSCTVDPENVKDKNFTWTTSNQSVAGVNGGTVTGVQEGECTITVETENGKTDTCSVVVEQALPDLQAIYDMCNSYGAEIADDGSYLSIDTNLLDIDDYYDKEAIKDVERVNNALDLPDSVMEHMNRTRAMDGMQTYETDIILVRWTYHPDNGLEVTYSLK